MLRIRKEQFDALAQDETLCRLELAGVMRRAYPEECDQLGWEGTEIRIERALEEARSHGISKHRDLERYLHLIFMFDSDTLASSRAAAWVEDILDWDGVSEELKLAALEKRCREETLRILAH